MKKSTTTCFSSVSSAAQLLRHLYPVQAMLHVGAGDGHAVVKKWQEWDIPQAVCIEANPEYKESLQDTAGLHDGWLAVSALIGEQEVQAEYYQASNPWESGIVPPEQWQRIWPNLSITDSVVLQQHRLDALLTEPPYKAVAERINWADIDCMPALPIIKGAGETIGQWDIVRVRVILDDSFAGVSDACLSEIIGYLAPHGFSCVAVTESHHPAVGEALFVRDWKRVLQVALVGLQAEQDAESKRVDSQLNKLTRSLDEQTRLAEERQILLDQAVQARTEQDKELADVRGQLKDVQNTTAEKEVQIQDLTNQLAENKKMLAEQAGLGEERQILLDQAVQARAGQDKQLSEVRDQLKDVQNTTAAKEAQIQDLTNQLAENKKMLGEERQILLDQAMQARAEQDKQLGEVRDQLEDLKNRTAEKEKQIRELNNQLAENKKMLAEQAGLGEERQILLDQSVQARTEQDKQLSDVRDQLKDVQNTTAEKEAQIQSLSNQLNEDKKTLAGKARLIEEQQQKINELQEKMREFQAGETEREHRQQLLDEELVKAEAQLALITDVLIREKNF